MSGDDATLDTRSDSLSPDRPAGRAQRWALVVAWSRRDGERIGEVAWIDPGRTWVLGRPGGRPGDRLHLVRQRPGRDRPGGPFASPFLSREQLRVRVIGADTLEVENVGRVELRLNGNPTRRARVIHGDVLELDGELVLLACLRDASLAPASEVGAFGAPDNAGLVGEGPVVWALRRRLAAFARQPGHVLVHGPSGTGKELVARALHTGSGRTGPLVACNAAAIPAGVAEAEWFGNRKDYPNPGMPARRGFAGEADGGTLFVDEIGELPRPLQAHLLRLLDSGEVQRLGDPRPSRVDVRIVAATNRDLSALKDDVLARFPNRLLLPSLGERPEDVPLLVRHLLAEMIAQRPELGVYLVDGVPRVTPRLLVRLLRHGWRTHVRELRQLLSTAVTEATGSWLDAGPLLTLDALSAEPPRAPVDTRDIGPDEIRAALTACDGVRTRAAAHLGLNSRHQLRRLMARLGMDD